MGLARLWGWSVAGTGVIDDEDREVMVDYDGWPDVLGTSVVD